MATSPWAPVNELGAPLQPVNELGAALPVADPTPVQPSAPVSPFAAPIADHQANLQKITHQINTPWGTPTNHPGTLGKIAHVLSVAGNIAGDIFAPAVTANIPGSELNLQMRKQEEEGALNREIADQNASQASQASTAKTEAETPEIAPNASSNRALQGAETAHAQEETDKLRNPDPTLVMGHARAVDSAIRDGRDPSTDPIVQQYEAAIRSTNPGFAKPEPDKTTDIKLPNGEVHTMGWDQQTGKYDKDEGVSGFKPAVTNVNAADAALDREATRLAKPHEKGVADANSQLEKIADARAMVNGNAESQALGIPKVLTALVSGQGSGVRITQPELNAIATARGVSGDFQGWLNSVSGKGKLTATQQQQLTGILDSVKERILAKQQIANDALDKINGAPDRAAVIEADRDARKKILDLEQHGHYAGQTVKLKNGQSIVVQHVHPDGSFD